MKRTGLGAFLLVVAFLLSLPALVHAQAITATLEGRVTDATGAALPSAVVTATNPNTGFARTTTTTETGEYRIALLPVGEYSVAVEQKGFRREVKKVTLVISQAATLDFSLTVGEITQEIVVEAGPALLEPTRTEISQVIGEQQIKSLPVNGRQFIDFALLVPGVTIGETTSGSTDVIIEPVTKISFAGQNIHYNLVEVDGADNISTASGVQKTTPSQEAVREFRVINTQYSVEAGRAVGGIVNIVTKSGTNDWHGSGYWFLRSDKLDANNILSSPDPQSCNTPGDVTSGGCRLLNNLRQNQFGATIGGPLQKDKIFFFGNYEGQRRQESPFYNPVILRNINIINNAKCTLFGLLPAPPPGGSCAAGSLPLEDLNVTRKFDYDQALLKVDASVSPKNYLFVRYFYNNADLTNQSPLNDGFELPSGYKNNAFDDNSLVVGLNTTFSSTLVNDLRVQYARRFFDFTTVTTQPRLEVLNTFTVGVNRGNPDFYLEPRFEIADSVSKTFGRHTLSFGGNFNWVRTTESFPLFYPFEAHFLCVRASECGSSFEAGRPFVLFFQRNDASVNFNESTLLPTGVAVYQGTKIPAEIRNLAKGTLTHYYNGLFIQDKWRATSNLTLNFGVRYEWELWPGRALSNDLNNVDPRFGFAYNLGTSKNLVLRGGAGIFHGIIPSPLLACQEPSCGGVIGPFPGRENKEDALDAHVRLLAFASDPGIVGAALGQLLLNGTYPDFANSTAILGFPCPDNPFLDHSVFNTLAGCGFFGDSVIVRFAKNHQAPYGIQTSLSLELEPFKDSLLSVSYLRAKGVHLGSFFDVNQGPNNGCPQLLHDSAGNTGLKADFHVVFVPGDCTTISPFPSTAQPNIAVYFEADSRWNSVYDGLLVSFNKRPSRHFAVGLSYTFSKTIDDGPNPSFVLIPQDATRIDQERAVSSDYVKHRFVGNALLFGPKNVNPLINDFELGFIVTLQSAPFFTKFAGFDANGNIFDVNDRVGIEPRNTFQGDGLYSVDVRVARSFPLGERFRLQAIAEAFNLFNTLNVRFFNTVYGAADFCNVSPPLHPSCGAGPFFFEGSPNPNYGTPRAVFNPRQVQLAVKVTF